MHSRAATVYTLSDTASDAAAARVAESENRADVIAGLDLSSEPDEIIDILIDLAKRETKTFSVHFARGLLNEMHNATRLHKDPLKSAGFRVLRAPDVPSVLIELGYLTNAAQEKQLTNVEFQGTLAQAIVDAVAKFNDLVGEGAR